MTEAAETIEPTETAAPVEGEVPPPAESGTAAPDPAAKEREELVEIARLARAKRREVERYKARRIEAETTKASYERQMAAVRQRAEELEREAQENPWSLLERSNVTPEQLVELAKRAGSPEEKQAIYEARIAALEKREEERLAQMKQAELERAWAGAQREFIQSAKDEDKYPTLNDLYEPEEILEKATEILRRAATNPQTKGIHFTDEEVLIELEKYEAARLERMASKKEERARRKLGTTGDQAAAPWTPGRSDSPRTLSPTNVSERASASKTFDDMTEAEQREHLVRILRGERG